MARARYAQPVSRGSRWMTTRYIMFRRIAVSHQQIQVGDVVEYEGEEWYVVRGPVMRTRGALFELSKVPPSLHGVAERELRLVRKGSR